MKPPPEPSSVPSHVGTASEQASSPGSSFPPFSANEHKPQAIPDHELLQRIGGGSYGEVWLARNALGAYRAVKIIHRKNFEDERPFEREFSGIQKFEPISRSHDGLVDILQVGRQNGSFYYVMELADAAEPRGEDGRSKIEDSKDSEQFSRHPPSAILDPQNYVPLTLRAVLKERGRLPVNECVEIALALTSGLGHLHKNSLVHRDIKPSNIIFVDGAPKLADIGLVTDADTTLSYVGTEGYIPPEGPGAAQADIFSLGKVLYEAVTGLDRRTFPDLPPEIRSWPDAAQVFELNEIILRACAQKLPNRYHNADELAGDLHLLRRNDSVREKHALQRRLRFTKRVLIGISAVMVLGVVPYYVAIQEARAARREAARARIAETDSKHKLAVAYLAQAQAGRRSHLMGRRFAGLDLVRQAAEIRPSLELRNEAIACLALPDLRLGPEWTICPPGTTAERIDPFGEHYAQAAEDGTIRLLRIKDHMPIATLPGFGSPVQDMRFSPDGRFLAAAYEQEPSRPVYIWDLARGEVRLKPSIKKARTMAFASQNDRIAVSEEAGDVCLYDLRSSLELRKLNHKGLTESISFAPNGDQLAVSTAGGRDLDVFDLESGKLTRTLPHSSAVFGVAWHPNGRGLAAGCANGEIWAWDMAAPGSKPRAVLIGHQAQVVNLVFSSSGEFLASHGWDYQLWLWNWSTGRAICERADMVLEGDFTPDDRWLPFSSAWKHAGLLEVALGHECRLLSEGSSRGCWSCAFSPDGQLLVAAHSDGVRYWDVRTGARLAYQPIGETRSVAFDPTGNKVITSGSGGSRQWPIKIRQADGNKLIEIGESEQIGPQETQRNSSLDSAGKILAFVQDEQLHLFDVAAKKEMEFSGLKGHFLYAALSPNARWCAACNFDTDSVVVLGIAKTKEILSLPGHRVRHLAFSPDGHWLVTCGSDEYQFWNTDDWRSHHSVAVGGYKGNFEGRAAFSPDSRMAAICYSKQLIRLVDPATGAEYATLEPDERQNLWWLAFSPDGAQLAAAGWTSTLQLWDLRLIRSKLATMNLDWDTPPATHPQRRAAK